MVTYNKFQDFSEQLARGKHALLTDTFKFMLTNVAPVATNAVKGDLTEITAQNGYTAGGPTTTIALSETGGTTTVTATQATVTASGGTVGPFRYVVLYNDTQTSPLKPLVAWWDYGTSITLQATETFTIKPNNTSPGTLFTLL